MFYREHEPAHFHAEHQGQAGKFDFSGKMIVGNIQSRNRASADSPMGGAPSGRTRGELDKDESRPASRQDRAIGVIAKMSFLPAVVRAEHRGGFRIHLAFNDQTESTVDFQQWLEGPIFEPLKTVSYFRRFFLDGGTVVWPNGADIAPETLYEAARATRSNKALQPAASAARGKRRG